MDVSRPEFEILCSMSIPVTMSVIAINVIFITVVLVTNQLERVESHDNRGRTWGLSSYTGVLPPVL